MVAPRKKEATKEVSRCWGPERDQVVVRVKQLITEATLLHFPDFSKGIVIHVDARIAGAGAFLAQQNGEDLDIIAYFSRRFDDSQRHYTHPHSKERYGVVFPIQHCRPSIWEKHCVTDRVRH